MPCANCLYFDIQSNPAVGGCRRHPPVPLAVPGQPVGIAYWPLVGAQDWCGEYVGADVAPNDADLQPAPKPRGRKAAAP